MPSLDLIRAALARHEPTVLSVGDKRQAAVAVILREEAGVPEVLFIERARHAADPWSGHMAFPGGRVDPADRDAQHAAERETLEEVGLSLEGAEALGRLDDMEGGRAAVAHPMVISAFVYHVEGPANLETNYEVGEAFWFPVPALLEAERHVSYAISPERAARFPGILVGKPDRHVVWGLTYRFLEVFFRAIGRPLPDRWDAFRQSEGVRTPAGARRR